MKNPMLQGKHEVALGAAKGAPSQNTNFNGVSPHILCWMQNCSSTERRWGGSEAAALSGAIPMDAVVEQTPPVLC